MTFCLPTKRILDLERCHGDSSARALNTTDANVVAHVGGALAVAVQSRRAGVDAAVASRPCGSAASRDGAGAEKVQGLARAHGVLDLTAGGLANGCPVIIRVGFDGVLGGGTAGVGDEEPTGVGICLGKAVLPDLPESVAVR